MNVQIKNKHEREKQNVNWCMSYVFIWLVEHIWFQLHRAMRGAKHAGCLLLTHALLLCRLVVCFDVHDILYVYPHSLIVPALSSLSFHFVGKGGRVDVQRYPVKPAMANVRPWGSTGVKIWFTYALPELPLFFPFSVFCLREPSL